VLEGSGGGRAENGKSHVQCLQQRVEAAVAGRKTRKPANNAYNNDERSYRGGVATVAAGGGDETAAAE
jgi:hypothetical protein